MLVRISNDLVKSLDLVNRRKLLSLRLGTSNSYLGNLIVILRTTSLSHQGHSFVLVLDWIAITWEDLRDNTSWYLAGEYLIYQIVFV